MSKNASDINVIMRYNNTIMRMYGGNMENTVKNEVKTKLKKPILRWILTVCFGVLMFVFIPSFASILYALVAFVVCPAKKVRAIWDKIIPKSKLRTMLVIVVAFIALLVSPSDETVPETVDSSIAAVENSEVMKSSVEQEIDVIVKKIADTAETMESVEAEVVEYTEGDGSSVSVSVEKNADADTLIIPVVVTPIPKPTATPEPTAEPTLMPTSEPTATPEAMVSTTYVLNTNTKKFHYETCRSVKQIKDKNKAYHTGTREECISMGYDPCGNCHP